MSDYIEIESKKDETCIYAEHKPDGRISISMFEGYGCFCFDENQKTMTLDKNQVAQLAEFFKKEARNEQGYN